MFDGCDQEPVLLGAPRFCSEKGKKLLRNMPKSCSKSCSNIFKTACLILITIAL